MSKEKVETTAYKGTENERSVAIDFDFCDDSLETMVNAFGESVVKYHAKAHIREALVASLKNRLVATNEEDEFIHTPAQIAKLPVYSPYVPAIPAQRMSSNDKAMAQVANMSPEQQAAIRDFLDEIDETE